MHALQKEIEGLKAEIQNLTRTQNVPYLMSSEPCGTQGEPTNASIELSSNALMMHSLSQSALKLTALERELLRSQSASSVLTARLDQNEKIVLGLEMKVKMRDSEIHRLKKVSGAEPVSDSDASSAEARLSEMADVVVVKEKLQAELLRYRHAFEELQRRLRVECCNTAVDSADTMSLQFDESVSIKSMFKQLWTRADDVEHSDALSKSFQVLQSEYNELLRKYEGVQDAKFLSVSGISVEDARDLTSQVCQLSESLVQAQDSELAVNRQYQIVQRQLLDCEEKFKSCRDRLEEVNGLASCRESELLDIINALKFELSEKDTMLRQQDDSMKKTESAAVQQIRQQEAESKASYLRAMKDNAVLIRSFRQLEVQLQAELNSRREVEEEMKLLNETKLVVDEKLNLVTCENFALKESLAFAEARNRTIDSQKSDLDTRLNEILEIKEKLDAALLESANELAHLQADYELACFDRDSAQEDNDHNLILVETLRSERETLIENLSNFENRVLSVSNEVHGLLAFYNCG